ncbi:MAG: ABC-type iron transport system, permease component [Bacteroidetes bacterium]|nr:ABC-type iron transport system, permease component [Bacteroidota bacterium]
MAKGNFIRFSLLIILFVTGCLLSLLFGGSKFTAIDFSGNDFIFSEIRIPKTITAILAGATLSVAGLILQVIFRNPLAGPYVLGISSGASLMVAVTILTGGAIGFFSNYYVGKTVIVLSSVSGSLLVTFLILYLAKKISSNVILLLIGLMLSQICGALQGALEYFADPNDLKSFIMWGMGSLSGTTTSDLWIFVPVSLLALGVLVFFIKPLNAFLLGQYYANNAGINYHSNRFYLILISSILTGITTAFCGPIAFVGIAVPLLSRMVFTTSDQKIHLFSCMMIGSCILLFSDVICHAFSTNGTLPVNMITTFVGAPLVIYLLFKNKQW